MRCLHVETSLQVNVGKFESEAARNERERKAAAYLPLHLHIRKPSNSSVCRQRRLKRVPHSMLWTGLSCVCAVVHILGSPAANVTKRKVRRRFGSPLLLRRISKNIVRREDTCTPKPQIIILDLASIALRAGTVR